MTISGVKHYNPEQVQMSNKHTRRRKVKVERSWDKWGRGGAFIVTESCR